MGEFVTVGRADEVPDNAMADFPLGPGRVVVARVDGTLYAFDDVCTHAACSLSDGELEGKTVVCPCHMGTFDLATGDVIDGPPPEPIPVYAVRVVEGDVQVKA